MSYDLKNGDSCPHVQTLERYSVDPFDFRSLRYTEDIYMRAPINGASQIRVFLQGTLVPSSMYQVVPDVDRTAESGDSFLILQFLKPMRTPSTLVEVSYRTEQRYCMRCSGLGTNHDWSVGASGSLAKVTKIQKLAQELNKYVLTSRNPFDQTLVCRIRDFIGHKFGYGVTVEDITSEITQILQRLQKIQASQSTVQTLDLGELLRSLDSVVSVEDPDDPTLVYTTVQCTSYQDNQPVNLNFSIKGSQ